MNQVLLDYYRCPEPFASSTVAAGFSTDPAPGFFKFGPELTCFGRSALPVCKHQGGELPDAWPHVSWTGSAWELPFDPAEVALALRHERYVRREPQPPLKRAIRRLYYAARPALPVRVRRHLQRAWLTSRGSKDFPHWPVDRSVDQLFEQMMRLAILASPERRVPFIWFWPEGHASCAIMTHDVETERGLQFAQELMTLNDSFAIKSSFQLIPDARYTVTWDVLNAIRDRGFEVNVHDLKHDGYLFRTEPQFRESAARINAFAREFGSHGFRSGVLYRNQEWFDALDVAYDMSVPNVARLDPQPGGCCTIMPFFIGKLLELPVTATQDYSLFHVLGTHSQDLWDQQIAEITRHHGLLSFIVHPDYLDTPEALTAYTRLLDTLSTLRSTAGLWICLPGELNTWWRQRSEMSLVPDVGGWKIEGQGSERARLAYASLHNDTVRYCFA